MILAVEIRDQLFYSIVIWLFIDTFSSGLPASLVANCHPQFMIQVIPDEWSRLPKMTRKVCGGRVNKISIPFHQDLPERLPVLCFLYLPKNEKETETVKTDWSSLLISSQIKPLYKTPYKPETFFL